MNTRTTITVVLIALALAIYVAVFETERFGLRGQTTREREMMLAHQPPEAGDPLFDPDTFSANQVETIRIQRGDQPMATYHGPANREAADTSAGQDRGVWRQVEPVAFPVDREAVLAVVEATRDLRQTLTVTVDTDENALDELGLDQPRGRVELQGPAMEPITLVLGRRTAAGRAFVAIGEPSLGSKVYVVGDTLHRAALERSDREMRSRSLAAVGFGSVQRAELKRQGEPAIELVRQGGRWRIVEPIAGRANSDAVRGVTEALTTAVVEAFVQDHPENLSAFGLDQPLAVLEVEAVERVRGGEDATLDEQRRTYKLSVGSPTDLAGSAYFAMLDDEPIVFRLGRAAVDRLAVAVDALRDRALTPTARADVREIQINRDGERLHVVRDGAEGWSFGSSELGYALDAQAMDRLLDAIFKTEAASFADASATDLPLLVTVEMSVVGRREPETLRLHGESDGSQVHVVRGDEAAAAVVERAAVEPMLAEARSLRQRQVIDLNDGEIERISITRNGTYAAEYELKREASETEGEPGGWDLQGYQHERVVEVFAELAGLRAETWLGDEADATGEMIEATITLFEGDPLRLTVWPAERVAKLEGEAEAFVVPSTLVDALTQELRETRVLGLEIEEIASVEADGKTVHRDRRGRFTQRGGDGLNEAAAAQLWDTLAGLRAEHLLLMREALPAEPDRTLRLRRTDGTEHLIALVEQGDVVFAEIDGRVMTLPREDGRVLLGGE
ncbi:MAG: DUF4340 domain-containing protein [Phycisphaeraceae bacterium]